MRETKDLYDGIDLDISYLSRKEKVLMMYNPLKLKNARLVRLDDYCALEIKKILRMKNKYNN